MKMKAIKLILIIQFLLTFFLFTGCQATPEQEVVIKRDSTEQAVMESAKNEETEIEPYEAPEHVEERFTVVEGVLDIVIDADVDVPDVDAFPVASVKSMPITQARADKIRKYFMKDGQLFTYKVQTKADYDAMIVEAKRGYEVDGEYVFDDDSQEWVDELIEQRAEAPDEDIPTEITDYSIDREDGLSGRIFLDGKEIGSLSIREDNAFMSTYKMFWVDGQTYYTGDDQKLEMKPCDINMTEEEAVESAEKILSDLGIEGMAVKEMHKAYFLDQDKRLEDDADYGGYNFVFMRTFGGLMPVKIDGWGMGPNDHFDASPPVDMEVLEMAINDSGELEQFSWRNPAEITGTLTEHVEILPFEDIMGRLEEFSKLQYAYMGEYENDTLWVKKVSKIGLNLNYMPIKNNPSEFMFAPCWYFTYKDSMEYTEEQIARLKERGIDPTAIDEQMGEEYIIFSAVDGASVSVYSSAQYDEMMQWRGREEIE